MGSEMCIRDRIKILTDFGSETVAGYTIAWKVLYFTILPSWGIAMAGAALVGQNLGAKQPDRAEESAWMAARYNMYILLVLSIIFIPLARQVLSLFSTDAEVIKQGALALQIIFSGYVFYAYEMVICLLYTSPSPRDLSTSRMPSSA